MFCPALHIQPHPTAILRAPPLVVALSPCFARPVLCFTVTFQTSGFGFCSCLLVPDSGVPAFHPSPFRMTPIRTTPSACSTVFSLLPRGPSLVQKLPVFVIGLAPHVRTPADYFFPAPLAFRCSAGAFSLLSNALCCSWGPPLRLSHPPTLATTPRIPSLAPTRALRICRASDARFVLRSVLFGIPFAALFLLRTSHFIMTGPLETVSEIVCLLVYVVSNSRHHE